MLHQSLRLVHRPKEFDQYTFGTNSENKKVLLLYNPHSSLHIDLTPLQDIETLKRGFADLSLYYFFGKTVKATTLVRSSILSCSHDKTILTVTIPIKSPLVFTIKEPRMGL